MEMGTRKTAEGSAGGGMTVEDGWWRWEDSGGGVAEMGTQWIGN